MTVTNPLEWIRGTAIRLGGAAGDYDALLEAAGDRPLVLLGEATHEMQLAREETFGPVVPLFRFDSEEEVLQAANDTPFGLAAYFYSQNMQRVQSHTPWGPL